MNKIIITAVFFVLLFPSIFSKIEPELVYSIKAEIFKNDTVIPMGIGAGVGTITPFPTSKKDYSIKVFGPNNRVIFDKDIDVSFIIYLEPDINIPTNSSIIHVRVPYNYQAKRIRIYHLDKIILDIDLSKELCDRDSICDEGENKYNCQDDCGKRGFGFTFIILMAVIIMAILFILIKTKRK